jgi:hypothetical protein
LSIYDLYQDKGYTPKKVILGICPEMLNSPDNQFWFSLKDQYYDMMKKIGLNFNTSNNLSFSQKSNKLFEIVSLSYFQQSVVRAFNNEGMHPTKEKFNTGATRVIDGSYNDGNYYTRKTGESIESSVKRLINKPAPELRNFSEISTVQIQTLEHFVTYLQSNGVEVVFYLLVYHPVYFQYVSKQYNILKKNEDYLFRYAAERHIRVVGQNNPENCDVSNIDFNDYSHLNKDGLMKVFKKSGEFSND